MIRISHVEKQFATGVKALKDINLEIGRGEFVVFLGPSGAGKSTLLRCINGFVYPGGGKVEVAGLHLNRKRDELKKIRTRVAMIFQQFHLVKRLSVLENVLCGSLARNSVWFSTFKFFRREDVELAIQCLERVGMKDKMHQRADQLSGGQQQRVAIARALVQKPSIMLADEPVASLDPKTSVLVMNFLKTINREDGMTVVVSLHDVELARKFADRIVGISKGQLVVDKPVGDLTERDLEKIYEFQQDEEGPFTGKSMIPALETVLEGSR